MCLHATAVHGVFAWFFCFVLFCCLLLLFFLCVCSHFNPYSIKNPTLLNLQQSKIIETIIKCSSVCSLKNTVYELTRILNFSHFFFFGQSFLMQRIAKFYFEKQNKNFPLKCNKNNTFKNFSMIFPRGDA